MKNSKSLINYLFNRPYNLIIMAKCVFIMFIV